MQNLKFNRMSKLTDVVLITGLSGSGKTIALNEFEDIGYYCIDNMPLPLFPKLIEFIKYAGSNITKVAAVCDIRDINIFNDIKNTKELMLHSDININIIFLEANKNQLINRYSQTRRIHPLSMLNNIPLKKAIESEKELMQPVKSLADMTIDTTSFSPNDLKRFILNKFMQNSKTPFIQLISFGFKYGLPLESDNIFDVRFLPNPYFVNELKNTTGLYKKTYDFVMDKSETKLFLNHIHAMLKDLLPMYEKESKNYLTISVGCTGGRHRSVTIVEHLKDFIIGMDFKVNVLHRDINK